MITSTSNNHIKLVRALQSRSHTRKVESAFVAEGVRLLEAAVNAQWPLDTVLFDQTLSERGRAIIEEIQQANLCDAFEITPNLMTDISDTETPQGILAVLKQKPLPLPVHPTFLVLADQVRDPGNMGTLLRTAEAAGADGIILSPGTVECVFTESCPVRHGRPFPPADPCPTLGGDQAPRHGTARFPGVSRSRNPVMGSGFQTALRPAGRWRGLWRNTDGRKPRHGPGDDPNGRTG